MRIREKIKKVVEHPANWKGRVWYGSYSSHDDIQDVQYALYCEIPGSDGEFAFLRGGDEMNLYITRNQIERKVQNQEPLPSYVVFTDSKEVVSEYAKQREVRIKMTVPDFSEKRKVSLKNLPKGLVAKLRGIAHGFYKSYL